MKEKTYEINSKNLKDRINKTLLTDDDLDSYELIHLMFEKAFLFITEKGCDPNNLSKNNKIYVENMIKRATDFVAKKESNKEHSKKVNLMFLKAQISLFLRQPESIGYLNDSISYLNH